MNIIYTNISKYKYKLSEDLVVCTGITGQVVNHRFFKLTISGQLLIKSGYLWDGVSGPMIDTEDSMIGGLVHDCFYQMIRLKLIPLTTKTLVDLEMKKLFEFCGMDVVRVFYAYLAVRVFGRFSCIPGDSHVPKRIELEF